MSISRREFIKLSAGAAALTGVLPATISKAAEQVVIPKRKFGRHDDMLSVVGLGGHTLYQAGSQKDADDVAHRALDLGINFFENAWDYHGGEAEEYMGNSIKGRRDDIFLMTKLCNFHNNQHPEDKSGCMSMLEDSLRRLKTDHIDLWMLHNIKGKDAERAYDSDGVIDALELAKKQGKIRYTGFTGHTTTQIHVDIINKGYDWDATLMPVSVVGALKSRAFEKEVMPLCVEKNIAVLGMKGFGGSRRTHLHGKTNIEEVLRYSLSYPQVCTHVVGFDKVEYVEMAVAASPATPMTPEDRLQFAVNDHPDSPDYYALHHGEGYYESGCCGGSNTPA